MWSVFACASPLPPGASDSSSIFPATGAESIPGIQEAVVRRPITVLFVALVVALALPALADAPPEAAEAAPPAKEAAPSAGGLDQQSSLERLRARIANMTPAEIDRIARLRLQGNCYFIRQVNQNLQKPREKPELVPLQHVAAAPIRNSDVSCLTDSIVRKAVAK